MTTFREVGETVHHIRSGLYYWDLAKPEQSGVHLNQEKDPELYEHALVFCKRHEPTLRTFARGIPEDDQDRFVYEMQQAFMEEEEKDSKTDFKRDLTAIVGEVMQGRFMQFATAQGYVALAFDEYIKS